LGFSLAGEGPGCTWRMTEKANGVKMVQMKPERRKKPLGVEIEGEQVGEVTQEEL